MSRHFTFAGSTAIRTALLASGLLLAACSPTPSPPPTAPAAAAPPSSPAKPATATTTQPQAAADANAWVLPGNLGPLTTRAELDARFGKANVREDSLPGAEGDGVLPVLTIYPDDPSQRLLLVLDAEQPNNLDAPIQELRITDANSRWRDRSGLHPGMSLAELVARNGAPISFYGLDWDYGGSVQDWHGGKLANGVGNALFHRVTLAARTGSDHPALPVGDRIFRSDDPRWPDLGKQLVIGELGISWPGETQ